MAKSKDRKHVHELYLARNLQRLIEALPYNVVLSLQNAVCSGLGWSYGKEDDDLEYPFVIRREVQLGTDDQRRLDFVLPMTTLQAPNEPSKVQYFDLREIVFELKIDKQRKDQVNEYVNQRPNAVLISLARSHEKGMNERILQWTWNDWFWGLLDLLSYDAQMRLLDGEDKSYAPKRFIPSFPLRPIGDLAEQYLEDFLLDLKQSGLAKVSEKRVLVAAGGWAIQTTKNNNLYFYGPKWDQDFNYVCAIHKKCLGYIGKVLDRITDVTYQDGKIKNREQILFDYDEWKGPGLDMIEKELSMRDEELKASSTSGKGLEWDVNVVLLAPVRIEEDVIWKNLGSEREYKGFGAFTQSHSYFKNPAEFIKRFTTPPREQDE